jgi:hypothetical protein
MLNSRGCERKWIQYISGNITEFAQNTEENHKKVLGKDSHTLTTPHHSPLC